MRDILDDKDIAPKPVEKAAPVLPTPNVTLATPSAPTVAASTPAAVQTQPAKETAPTAQPAAVASPAVQQPPAAAAPTQVPSTSGTVVQVAGKETSPFRGAQERPESTKVILTGDRLRKYFPDVSMTPREIEESIYDALEERRQRQEKAKQKPSLMNSGQSR